MPVGPSCTVGQSYVSGNSVGTICEAACAAGESQICDAVTGTGECPSGKTCTPTKLHGNQVGFCL
jgi:hypothetical protein